MSSTPRKNQSLVLSVFARIIGWTLILGSWLVCLCGLVVIVPLSLLFIDSRVLDSDICEDRIEILDIAGFSFFPSPANAIESTSYEVRFSDGSTGTIAFTGSPGLSIGRPYKICFKKTRLFGIVEVLEFEAAP